MTNLLKRLFSPKYTDKKVAAIHAETKKILDSASETSKRQKELLEKNGLSMLIVIATGGDKHGH
jgi:hypothetical protein